MPGCSIQKLSLKGNKFSILGITAILKALLDSPVLTYLNLSGHSIDTRDHSIVDSYDRVVGTALRTVVIDGMTNIL